MFKDKTMDAMRKYLNKEEGFTNLTDEELEMNIELCIDDCGFNSEDEVYVFLVSYL